ncbi:glutamine amidotransferase, partial [Streptosporangium sandarakinum]
MQSDSILRLVWIYPDLLSTYGDQGNVLILEQRAQRRGIPVQTIHVRSADPVPESGDIYLIGGGEDRPQILAAERLRRDGGLNRAVARGATLLAVCAGYQIMGSTFGGEEGQPVQGIGLLDIASGRGSGRAVGELAGEADPALGIPMLTGFENHMGV